MTQLSYCTYHTCVCTIHIVVHTTMRTPSLYNKSTSLPAINNITHGATVPVPIAAKIAVPAAVADYLISPSVNISDLSATEWS